MVSFQTLKPLPPNLKIDIQKIEIKEVLRDMQHIELLQKLQIFLGQKTTFKKIANKIGIDSESLIDMMTELENEEKIKFLPLGNGFIRIGEIEGFNMSDVIIEFPKSDIFFNSYTNKKGIRKISINLSQELSVKLANNDQDVINAIIYGIKKEI